MVGGRNREVQIVVLGGAGKRRGGQCNERQGACGQRTQVVPGADENGGRCERNDILLSDKKPP